MHKPVTPKAKAVILVSQVVSVVVAAGFGGLLVAETWRDVETSRGTVGQWVVGAIGATFCFGLVISVLQSMVQVIRQPSTAESEPPESRDLIE